MRFVTVNGETVKDNLTKAQAIATGKKLYSDSSIIGIGKYKYIKGVRCYSVLPLNFYIQ